MPEKNRVAVFVDWANVFRQTQVDIAKFRQFVDSLGDIKVAYVYMVDFSALSKKDDPIEAKRSPSGFWNLIRRLGFRLRLKAVKVIEREGRGDLHKANWDVGMTLDILTVAQSGKVDEIVLFSGDGDFAPLIEAIQNPPHLIRVTVVANGKQTASELRQVADQFIDLAEHYGKFARPYEGRPRREIVEEAVAANSTMLDVGAEEEEEGTVAQEEGIPELD